MDKINIADKLNQINDYWNPRIAAELNGQQVKLVKVKGSFPWHQHEHEDEMFLVLKGVLLLEFRDKTIQLHENEFAVVPRGVEHRPIAPAEVSLMLFEPSTTLNTGNVNNEFTKKNLDSI